MKRIPLILYVLCIHLWLTAQNPGGYPFLHLSTSDGLSQNSISHIMQDKQGMIWLATQSGIDKYVGGEFRYYSRVEKRLNENVTALIDWNKDSLLVATESGNFLVHKWKKNEKPNQLSDKLKGILLVDKSSKNHIVFTPKKIAFADAQLNQKDSITWEGDSIYQVIQHRDKFYIADSSGLWVFKKPKNTPKLLKDKLVVKALFVDAIKNRLYFASELNKIYVYDTQTEQQIDSINISGGPPNESVTALFVANSTTLWIGTQKQGLYLYDLIQKKILTHYRYHKSSLDPFYFSSNQINCIYGSKEGVIWIGSQNGGLNLWQPGKLVFHHMLEHEMTSTTNRLMKKVVWSIYAEPNSDKVWVGLDEEGVACLSTTNPQYARQFRTSDQLSTSVYALREHKGRFYMGTNNGIYQMSVSPEGTQYRPLIVGNSPVLEGERITKLDFDPLKAVWYAGRRQAGKIYQLSEQFELLDTIPLLEGDKLSFVFPSKDATWVGTFNGLFRIDPKTNNLQQVYKDNIGPIHFTCAVVSGQKLWAGTDRKGLYEFDIASDGRLQNPVIHNGQNGFPLEVIYEIQKDGYGNIWLSTNHGLYCFNTTTKSFNHYGLRHGFQLLEFNSGALFSKKDTLFFGGVGGLCYFRSKYLIDSLPPHFKPILETTYYGKKAEYIPFDINTFKDTTLTLPYKFGYVELLPVLGHYHDPSNNSFRISLNSKILPPREDGSNIYIIEESEVRWAIFGLGNKDTITIQYRTGNGFWQKPGKIIVTRELFFDSSNWLIIPLAVLAILFVLSVIKYLRGSDRLRRLQEKINELSKEEETQKVCGLALVHLTQDLGYEYAAIALVDFDQKRIKTNYIKDPSLKAEQMELWRAYSDYGLSEQDILPLVAKLGEPVSVIANHYVSNDSIQFDSSLFNSVIADELQHKNLARIFIPFVHRLPSSEDFPQGEQTVLGVVEAGFRMSRFNSFFVSNKITWLLPAYRKINVEGFLKTKQIYLQLYVDNLAQPYFKSFIKEEKRKIYGLVENKLEKKANENEEDSNAFLKHALIELVDRINAGAGDIALSSFNAEIPDYNNNDIDCGRSDREKRKKTIQSDIHQNFFRKINSANAFYYEDNTHSNDQYTSVLSMPMAIHQSASLVGVFTLMSDQKNFFNPVLKEVYQKAVRKITDVYLQKKRYEALQQIAQPLNNLPQTQEVLYIDLLQALGAYFKSDYISIWVRKSPGSLEFNLSKATDPGFYKLYKRANFLTKKIKSNEEKELREHVSDILEKKDANDHVKGTQIRKFCEKHKFVSYIVLKIIRDDRYQAFINVFSKRPILDDEISGYSKSLLEEVAQKAAIAERSIYLFGSFREIAESLAIGKGTLQKIVDQAYLLAPSADSVVLFPYNQEPIRIKDAVIGGGNLPPEDKKDPYKKANLANFIIANGTEYFKDEKHYIQVARQTASERPERETFWVKRGLKSVAAIRMQYNGNPVGVMIFNYTEKKAFEETDKQTIEAFANYATIALINENYIQQIRDESALLNERIDRLAWQEKTAKKEAEILHNEKKEQEALLRKISEKAAGESFYVILQGINHDIRNHLLSIEGQLEAYLEKIKDGKEKEEFNAILESIYQQSDKIGALLILFKPSEVAKREVFDINDTILKVTHIFGGTQPSLNFHKEFGKNIPELITNKTEFSMVIYNLVKNAVSAINEVAKAKGKITLNTSFENKHFVIKIADNGIGIDNDYHDKIFELGYTTKPEGTGVGLFFVKETVEQKWEGRIRVVSQKGNGSTFIIEIPEYINFKK